MSPLPTAVVCRGSSCRTAGKCAFERLCEMLDEMAIPVTQVDCLGHCTGPVAVLPVGDTTVVVEKVRGRSRRSAVAESLSKAKVDPVRKLTLTGKKEHKALRRVERSLAKH